MTNYKLLDLINQKEELQNELYKIENMNYSELELYFDIKNTPKYIELLCIQKK